MDYLFELLQVRCFVVLTVLSEYQSHQADPTACAMVLIRGPLVGTYREASHPTTSRLGSPRTDRRSSRRSRRTLIADVVNSDLRVPIRLDCGRVVSWEGRQKIGVLF